MEARDFEQVKEALKAERIWRTTGTNKEDQLTGIEKQLE